MAQRGKTRAAKGSGKDRAPRRMTTRVSKGRKRASGRRSRVLLQRPDYKDRHGVDVEMPNPERWRFKEERN